MASSILRHELTCCICTDIYTDPVTLTCGHSFCRICLNKTLDRQEEREYSCPVCRHRFRVKPELKRALNLDNIAQHVLSKNPQQEARDIFCLYCISRPVPAAKTCLQCEVSLCEKHLKKHSKSPEHFLAKPTTFFGSRKCPVHKKTLIYYCSEEAACICSSCVSEKCHKGHRVEKLSDAFWKKKDKLKQDLLKVILRKKENENSLKHLQEHRSKVTGKVVNVTERVTTLIQDVREQLDNLEKQVLSEVTRQEKQIFLCMSNLERHLEMTNEDLSKEMCDIEEMSDATDPLFVLQNPNHCDVKDDDKDRENKELPVVGDLNVSTISLILHTGLADIVTVIKSKERNVLDPSDILPDADTPLDLFPGENAFSDIVLDVKSVANNLSLSCDFKTISWTILNQNRQETSKRFQFNQVLSSNVFSSGQHCWMVEGSELGEWRVGVAYPSMNRKGEHALIGDNKTSWGLWKWNNQYAARHGKEVIVLPFRSSCETIGICLDYEAGRLSFFELCQPVKHLHTFTTSFTEPLCAAFGVWTYTFLRILNSANTA